MSSNYDPFRHKKFADFSPNSRIQWNRGQFSTFWSWWPFVACQLWFERKMCLIFNNFGEKNVPKFRPKFGLHTPLNLKNWNLGYALDSYILFPIIIKLVSIYKTLLHWIKISRIELEILENVFCSVVTESLPNDLRNPMETYRQDYNLGNIKKNHFSIQYFLISFAFAKKLYFPFDNKMNVKFFEERSFPGPRSLFFSLNFRSVANTIVYGRLILIHLKNFSKAPTCILSST